MSSHRPCPACGESSLREINPGEFECSACGTSFVSTSKNCPSCGQPNPWLAEDCSECGEPLSISAQVILRQTDIGEPYWLRKTRSRAEKIKQSEQQASETRMEVFQEIDRRRLESEAQAIAEQKSRDTRLLTIALVLLGTFLLIILIISGFIVLTGS